MQTILLNFLIIILIVFAALLILNSYQTIRLKSDFLRPMVKTAVHQGLQTSFDFFAEKISIKSDVFISAFTEKFYEQAKLKLPKATIEKIEVLEFSDQNINITVKTPGLIFQEVEYSYATITGSKTVWSMVSELGLLDFYLQNKAAVLRKKLEQEREIFSKIEENVARIIKKLPVHHAQGIRQYNWDEILTILYNRGEIQTYQQVKDNYKLLKNYEQSVA